MSRYEVTVLGPSGRFICVSEIPPRGIYTQSKQAEGATAELLETHQIDLQILAAIRRRRVRRW